MAAVRSPPMPSPSASLMSGFSPYTESPSSPAAPFSGIGGDRSSTSSSRLQPQTLRSPQATSPSDIADPSPIVSSNGTEFDETITEERSAPEPKSATSEGGTSQRESIKVRSVAMERDIAKIPKLVTKDDAGNSLRPPSSEDDHPPSVILAPKGFDPFPDGASPSVVGRVTPTPSQLSEVTVVVPSSETSRTNGPLSPPPISTDVPRFHDVLATPQAQTRQDAEREEERRLSRNSTHLEDIPEKDSEADDEHSVHPDDPRKFTEDNEEQIKALRTALVECWTLCNTLAGLSHIHRKRAFQLSRKVDGRERAWESCWTLCQKLYGTWDEQLPSLVGPTLAMCRNFCQDLFEVRQRDDDDADAVLRVSFELNNHLYNTHDRALPEAYRERTLDFYITLCHRLMKQRNKMAEETDDLLRACWALAEMLFSLRQSKRDGKPQNEELLGSAVQACWELCDIFREGWTQVRPDRGTPRPSRANFTPTFHQREVQPATVTLDETEFEDDDHGRLNPETPTTVFEDLNLMSPDESSVPNIVVLGPDSYDSRYSDWSSSASSRSGYASSDEKTNSSASTVHQSERQQNEDPRVTCMRILIVRAAINLGFQRDGSDSFITFVKRMPSNAFGSQVWQVQLLEEYKRLIAGDSSFRNLGPLRRATATDVARSVSWMVGSGQWAWFRDLYRSVFGFRVEEAGNRPGLAIEG